MDERRREYLRLLGVQALEPRGDGPLTRSSAPPPTRGPVAVPAPGPRAGDDWEALARRVRACTACGLAATRNQTVFGAGDHGARWMLVGEAPGAEEDRQGLPFVGRAGQLLTSMVRALGWSRDQVFIANILKCRPPNNRDPRPEEVAHCEGYLQAQVALLRPAVILCLGRIAAQNLLKVEAPLKTLRGRTHSYGPTGTPLVVTFHPAYLLRNPADKRRAWEDLRLVLRLLEEAGERARG